MTTGATREPEDRENLLMSTTSSQQTASSSDVQMSSIFTNVTGVAHRIYCGSSGNIAIQRINDSGFTVYPVLQGMYVDGRVKAVGGTGSGTSSGFVWIAEI